MSSAARRALVDRADPALPVVAQCRLLKIARSTLYYQPAAVSEDDLALMRRMDELIRLGRSTARAGWWRCCVGMAWW